MTPRDRATGPGVRPRRRGGQGRRLLLLGGVLAVALTTAIALATGPRRAPTADCDVAARLVSDCDGAITDWLLGLADNDQTAFDPIQAALVAKAHPAIRFHVYYATPARRARFERAVRRQDPAALARVRWHPTPGRVWPWMRDLFLAATTADGVPVTVLHHPDRYRNPQRPSAGAVPLFARTLDGIAVQTAARLDGGSLVVDAERVLASTSLVAAARAHGEAVDGTDLLRQLDCAWGARPTAWIDLSGVHVAQHCDLVMMPAGARRMAMASPALGARLLATLDAPGRAAFTAAFRRITQQAPAGHALAQLADVDLRARLAAYNERTDVQAAYGGLERRVARLGYACSALPHLDLVAREAGLDVCLSYVNVVIDERDGRRTVYMPTYRLPPLDTAAADTWRALGYDVVTIDCLATALQGGGLHCLSQVFRR